MKSEVHPEDDSGPPILQFLKKASHFFYLVLAL
jgi:hypothetical protein